MPGVTTSNALTMKDVTKMTQDIILTINENETDVALYILFAVSAAEMMWKSVDVDVQTLCIGLATSPTWENADPAISPWVGRLTMTFYLDPTKDGPTTGCDLLYVGHLTTAYINAYLKDIDFRMNKPTDLEE